MGKYDFSKKCQIYGLVTGEKIVDLIRYLTKNREGIKPKVNITFFEGFPSLIIKSGMKKYILSPISESVGPWYLWSSSSLRMKLTNERSDRELDDQSGARGDGGPWQPRRVTVSQSPCTGSSLWQTPDQDWWDRANCSCHLPKGENSWLFLVLTFLFFCVEDFILDTRYTKYFQRINTYLLSVAFQTRQFSFHYETGSQATLHRCWIFFQLGIRDW